MDLIQRMQPSSLLAPQLLLCLPGHKGTASTMWLWGAGGARISSKANQMYVLGLGRRGRTSHSPVDHMALCPPLVLLRAVSVQDSFRGKLQLVLKAHHLGVVLAQQLIQLAILPAL